MLEQKQITLKMPLINWEINLILTWSANSAISDGNNTVSTFAERDTKLDVLVVTLSINDNKKLL